MAGSLRHHRRPATAPGEPPVLRGRPVARPGRRRHGERCRSRARPPPVRGWRRSGRRGHDVDGNGHDRRDGDDGRCGTDDDHSPTETEGSAPGFGVVAALAALLIVVRLEKRRQ
ncbi:PGF-CTERM sorting domain-containing protein [Haloplanus litoreus]|uniref:PGF-CTERM sorting domain-containing protein n=1 Tax=Haloplanus litoreus TaxID=767515 RepID=UPI003613E431